MNKKPGPVPFDSGPGGLFSGHAAEVQSWKISIVTVGLLPSAPVILSL